MKVVGLTGGSGTGKSTALGVLAEMGAVTIDCDVIYHELLEAGGAMLDDIEARFPGVVVGGKLQRKALGQIVFRDPIALANLNAITHGHVCRVVDEELKALAECGTELVAIEAIALIESGLGERCDVVIGVLAPLEARAQRITAREGIDPDYAKRRIESQKPDVFFRAHCDHIIENDYPSPAAFLEACRGLFEQLVLV